MQSNVGKLRSLALSISLFLAGCVSDGQHAPTEDRDIRGQGTSQTTTRPGDAQSGDGFYSTPLPDPKKLFAKQAQNYLTLSTSQSPSTAIDTKLSAAELFLKAEDSNRAAQAVSDINITELNIKQNNRYQIVKAYIDYSDRNSEKALTRLESLLPISNSNQPKQSIKYITLRQRIDALLLASFCHQDLGQFEPAVARLIERERLLTGSARAETSRYIWQVINLIPQNDRLLLIASTQNSLLRNRLEQSLSGRIDTHLSRPTQFDRWRDSNRLITQPEQTAIRSTWNAQSPRSIAVLLPESSKYKRAAKALKDGFNYWHQLNDSTFKPQITFYDLGDQPELSINHYSAALQSGTDLVIGPLGKGYADNLNLAVEGDFPIPTLLLGGELDTGRNAMRFDLNPNNESKNIADYAFNQGYTNTVILVPTGKRGERAANSFQKHWLALGGKVNKVVPYSPKQFDHSTELTLMFNLNQSTSRHIELSNTLGHKPEFSPYRRNDIDFIYLVGDGAVGRIIRPQINFFGGQSLPVIASSSIYSGVINKPEDMDLNQTTFPSMPWQLIEQNASPYAGVLNQLFALGTDAYQLAAQMQQFRRNPTVSIQGNTGKLRFGQHGQVIILPVWTKFEDGLAVPLSPSELESVQLDTQTSVNSTNQSAARSYDESNWNKRESRRKPGT